MVTGTDIDIDLADRRKILDLIPHISACQRNGDTARKHNSGVYPTAIPFDAIAGHAAIDYQEAEQRGYFKIDFLNMSVYQLIRDQAHYDHMLAQDPDWSRLWQDSDWSAQLVHVGNYRDLLGDMKPDSVARMAAFISVIRPGKAHLQRRPWDEVFTSVWDGDTQQGYTFKKSHAVSYAHLVMLHMNLLSELNPRA